jgi:NAD kinase
VVTTRLTINGHSVYQLRGDGIIVSTATGSTAYALSAGGPILSPESRAMALVPLASHTLISRSIVTAPQDIVRIELPDVDRSGVILSIDGNVVIDNVYLERSKPSIEKALTHIDLSISKDHWVSLIKTSTRLFFDTLATEFYRHED